MPGTLRHKQFEAARTMLLVAVHIKPVTLASMSFYVRLEDIPQPYKPQPPSIVQAPTLSTRLSREFWYLRESLGRDLMWYIYIYVCAGLEKNHRIPALGLMAIRACLHELRNNCAGPG